MEPATQILGWCHIWEGHQGQINHLEWFLSRDPHNQALAQKIDYLKEQCNILIELMRAELRPNTESHSAA
jgi:hypothetical protein